MSRAAIFARIKVQIKHSGGTMPPMRSILRGRRCSCEVRSYMKAKLMTSRMHSKVVGMNAFLMGLSSTVAAEWSFIWSCFLGTIFSRSVFGCDQRRMSCVWSSQADVVPLCERSVSERFSGWKGYFECDCGRNLRYGGISSF
jgi:hypothetical protein